MTNHKLTAAALKKFHNSRPVQTALSSIRTARAEHARIAARELFADLVAEVIQERR